MLQGLTGKRTVRARTTIALADTSRAASKLASVALRAVVRGYQLLISPLLGHNCRYLPGCSAYALEALERHGAARGSWLALRRICRCHPWSGHGFDPVPDPEPCSNAHHCYDHATPSAPGPLGIPSKG